MRSLPHDRLQLEVELRTALREGQLRVHYQPIVDAATGTPVSLEALVRWQHPERGLVSPGEFIPVAEDSGLIVEVGGFVLNEACRQLAAWRETGVVDETVGMAINASARQLALPDFPDHVAGALRASGLDCDPSVVRLEITETLLMSDEAHAEVLTDVASLGVGLSLDDFGTGASALARLQAFPIDTLKIDRSFVSRLDSDERTESSEAIVAAIMALARALQLDVVAEGVETVPQLERLRELGCRRIQGFLFSKPLDPGNAEAFLLAPPSRPSAASHG